MAGAAGGDLPFVVANGMLAVAMSVLAVRTEEFRRLTRWVAGKIKERKLDAKRDN